MRRIDRASKAKAVHIIQVRHRDEVEPPLTNWLREAYELSDLLTNKPAPARAKRKSKPKRTVTKKTAQRRSSSR